MKKTYNGGQTLIDAVKEALGALHDADLVKFWNIYCDENNCQDDAVYALENDVLDEVIGDVSPHDLLWSIQGVHFDMHDNWFQQNVDRGTIESAYHAEKFIDIDELAEWMAGPFGNWEELEDMGEIEEDETEDDEE